MSINITNKCPPFLSTKHSHERDSHITFDEGPHIYTIDGDSSFKSVTTFNHSFFEKFDADKVISNMMASKKWPDSQYFGMSANEIKAKWNKNGKEASAAGTKMHEDIEYYYNNSERENNSIEYEYFKRFVKDYERLIPYRTEWMVWDKELKLAGSIDMVYEGPDGILEIYDWKRCKEIVKGNSWGKYGTNPIIEHLPDTNFWHYSLQLNTYKYMLEKNYGKTIGGMYLVCLHPDNKNNSYQRIKVADLSQEVGELMKERLAKLNIH